MTSLANPKAILVYVAVLPQFVRPQDALPPQLLLIVPTALVITAAVYVVYCAFGVAIVRLLSTARRRLAFHYAVAGFYLFSAFGLACLRQQRT